MQTSLRDCDGEMDLSLDPLQSRGWRRMGPERSARHYSLICGAKAKEPEHVRVMRRQDPRKEASVD